MELPKWANAFRLVQLVQPSSAAAERVFSFLQHFTAQQQSPLEDYLELSACCNTTLLIKFYQLCLYFNYSLQKRNFWKTKWVKERAKWVKEKANGRIGKAKWVKEKANGRIGKAKWVGILSIKEKKKKQKKANFVEA